jgi:hypothetical protein
MTDVYIQNMVKCPMLYEHDPCDLVPANDCQTCEFMRWVYGNKIDCGCENDVFMLWSGS